MKTSRRIGLAIAGATLLAGSAGAATPTKTYLMKAGASDLFETKTAMLEVRSSDPAIAAFAKQMIKDHGNSTLMVKKAALQSGYLPTKPMLDAKQKSDYAALQAASGTDRDKLYVTQQKAAHQDALALQKDYAANGAKPLLKDTAGKIVPVVQSHIAMLDKM